MEVFISNNSIADNHDSDNRQSIFTNPIPLSTGFFSHRLRGTADPPNPHAPSHHFFSATRYRPVNILSDRDRPGSPLAADVGSPTLKGACELDRRWPMAPLYVHFDVEY